MSLVFRFAFVVGGVELPGCFGWCVCSVTCMFGLCVLLDEVVAMVLVVWNVMKFGGVMVVGGSLIVVCVVAAKWCLGVLGCVVVDVVVAAGGVIVVEFGLLLSGWEYEVGVYVGSDVCVCIWFGWLKDLGMFVFASHLVC